LTLRIAVERIKGLLDHVLRLDTPIEDFPDSGGMRSNKLIVYYDKGLRPLGCFSRRCAVIRLPLFHENIVKKIAD
jgi:hypothetical protein